MSDSIAYVSSCRGAYSDALASALFDGGARVLYGWKDPTLIVREMVNRSDWQPIEVIDLPGGDDTTYHTGWKHRGPHQAPTHAAFPDAETIKHMRAYLVIAQFAKGVSQMASCPTRTGSCQLNNLMRMLWEQHATWTRMTIISIAEALPDEAQTITRLLRNPGDIAAVFRPLYGNEVADRLDSLITDHLAIAADLVRAAKTGDSAAAAEIERRWYANADEIAAFLSCINPYWSREGMTRMWHEHLSLVKAQAVARLKKDYRSDIALYDEGEILLLEMADDFTCGIIRQFPHLAGGAGTLRCP